MTRFATSVLDQMKRIWKPYVFGALGAVALALVVAAAGGLFVSAEAPKSGPINGPNSAAHGSLPLGQ